MECPPEIHVARSCLLSVGLGLQLVISPFGIRILNRRGDPYICVERAQRHNTVVQDHNIPTSFNWRTQPCELQLTVSTISSRPYHTIPENRILFPSSRDDSSGITAALQAMTADRHPTESSGLLHQHTSSLRRLDQAVPFYARPKQRQRWDDTQLQPHVNWGDLFWDLFYVSAAYNLAASLKESLNLVRASQVPSAVMFFWQ
jgi:hypothetical protein